MMNNRYRMHRWRSLRHWAIIGALCIGIVYAGCADSADSAVRHTDLTDGKNDFTDVVPITTVRNIAISHIRLTDIHSGIMQIAWTNPSAHTSQVLDKIVIDWNASNNYIDDARNASGSYIATHTLTADAKTSAILPRIPTGYTEYQIILTALYRDGSNLPPVTVNYRYTVDDDGDNLIDIYTLEALSNIRCNPEGTAYQAIGSDGACSEVGIRCGIDGNTDCIGYELRRDLNFSEHASYAAGRINSNWRPNSASDGSGRLTTANDGKNRGWAPIENIATAFEGNGHTIENLYVRDITAQDYQLSGLFGRVNGSAAHIRNVTLNATRVYGGDGDYSHVGALAGELNGGTIEDVAVIGGKVYGNGGVINYIGGLVGKNTNGGTVRNSYTNGPAYGGSGGTTIIVGGLVGLNTQNSAIIASHATGNVYGGDDALGYVGGLVGYNDSSTITASYATGDTHGNNGGYESIGGLVGLSIAKSAITTSHATGNAHGKGGDRDRVGGLVGYNNNSSITNSHATGNADGSNGVSSRVGGLVGYNLNGSIANSYATGNADGSGSSGGLVGYNNNSAIFASYATGDANGGDGRGSVGGLVGYAHDSAVTVSYATGNANGNGGDNDRVGGLIGESFRCTIIASYATGTADGGSGDYDRVGGLIGENSQDTVIASYATGDVDGGGSNNDRVGGLVGYSVSDTTISASYATGNASNGAASQTNALVGLESSTGDLTVRNSYGFGSGGRRYGSSLLPGASRASLLTAPVASNPPNTAVPQVWDSVAERSKGAWDFGTSVQLPALRYADYDGDGDAYNCDQFPAPCGTLIPGQR